jgi:hypothetical protein
MHVVVSTIVAKFSHSNTARSAGCVYACDEEHVQGLKGLRVFKVQKEDQGRFSNN